ncbi:translin associated factor X interacting protein 1, partial [Homo sapiens]
MACQQSRYHSFSSASRLQPRPSGVTIDESFLTEDKSTQNRKLLQKRRTLTGQFSMGGHLSPWPTYTSGQTILQNRKPCSDDYRKRVGSCQQHPFRTAKPQYLEELENYLRKELLLLDLGTDSTQELRLQVTKLRKNLAEEYLHYLSERDACKILIADLNELRYQREDMSLA